MSKMTSAPEKKRLAYTRDHVTLAEYPHAFRKKWPKKMAKEERATRHKVRQVLQATGDDSLVGVIRRKQMRKWGTVSLRECVKFKQWKRQQMMGAHQARRLRWGHGEAVATVDAPR